MTFLSGDPAAIVTHVSAHLDRVTHDYFSRDPVGDTVGINEKPLEAAF